MLMLLPIIVALAADPSPTPGSATRPTPLTEIGRVRALPACVPIVAHANGAITETLENDRTLTVISTNLRNTDYDKLNSIQRRNAFEMLLRNAEAIAKAAKAGDAEVKRLREYATNSPDPKRKEELKTFADALGGALYRQQKAAVEVERDVAITRGRESAQDAKEQQQNDFTSSTQRGAPAGLYTPAPLRPTPTPDPLYDKRFKYLADKMDELNQGIMRDEGIAADHSIAATSGC
ncbi:MAG TPA: hypothetical protein VGU66_13905 [Candidatus Elarobacter sp.]|nr:hypothetical protein [Candidatus Elarobacter sp.]